MVLGSPLCVEMAWLSWRAAEESERQLTLARVTAFELTLPPRVDFAPKEGKSKTVNPAHERSPLTFKDSFALQPYMCMHM